MQAVSPMACETLLAKEENPRRRRIQKDGKAAKYGSLEALKSNLQGLKKISHLREDE